MEFTTNSWNKKDLFNGLPSIAVWFETGRIKLPRGNEKSCQITDKYCSQFNSMAFDDDKGKLESVCEHDDCCLSFFFAVQGLLSVNSTFRISIIEEAY
jgi:hypothetical protein